MASSLEIKFAKLLFSDSNRMRLYKKLAALISNGVPIDTALKNLHTRATEDGKKPNETTAIIINDWLRGIRNGQPLADSMGHWVPNSERMIILAGEQSGDLPGALMSVIKVVGSASAMRGAMMGGILYPGLLGIATLGVIMLFSIKVIPMFAKVSNPDAWTGLSMQMYVVSNFVNSWYFVGLAAFVVMSLMAMVMSMPLMNGRLRVKLDKFPPWSTYRVWVGSGFMISLAAMVKSGTPIQRALQELQKNASPWLSERISGGLQGLSSGLNLGEAFLRAGHDFPDKEIIDDLIVYSNQSGFDKALEIIGNEWIESGTKRVQAQAAILNGVAMMIMGAVIAWIVLGTFDLQTVISDSIQAKAG